MAAAAVKRGKISQSIASASAKGVSRVNAILQRTSKAVKVYFLYTLFLHPSKCPIDMLHMLHQRAAQQGIMRRSTNGLVSSSCRACGMEVRNWRVRQSDIRVPGLLGQ